MMDYRVTDSSLGTWSKGAATKTEKPPFIHLNRPEIQDEFPCEIIPNYCTPCTIENIGNGFINDSAEENLHKIESTPPPEPDVIKYKLGQTDLRSQVETKPPISLREPTENTLQTWKIPLSSYVPPSFDPVESFHIALSVKFERHALRRKHRQRHRHKLPEHQETKEQNKVSGKTPVLLIVPLAPAGKKEGRSKKITETVLFAMPTLAQIKEKLLETKKIIICAVKTIWPFLLECGDYFRRISAFLGVPHSPIPQDSNQTTVADSSKSKKPKLSKTVNKILDWMGLPY